MHDTGKMHASDFFSTPWRFCIQTGKSILGILAMAFLSCPLQPESSSIITRFCTKAGKIHFPDPVLQIRLFLSGSFFSAERKAFNAFRYHSLDASGSASTPRPSAHIRPRSYMASAFPALLPDETDAWLPENPDGDFYSHVQIAAGQFVLSAPFCFCEVFLFTLKRVRDIQFRVLTGALSFQHAFCICGSGSVSVSIFASASVSISVSSISSDPSEILFSSSSSCAVLSAGFLSCPDVSD